MKCAVCRKPVTKAEAVLNHIVPLSRGGGHGDDNLQTVHRACHRKPLKWRVRIYRAVRQFIGDLMCDIGRHAWRPAKDATIEIDWRSKWEAYEVASEGICSRCGETTGEIRRDYYW